MTGVQTCALPISDFFPVRFSLLKILPVTLQKRQIPCQKLAFAHHIKRLKIILTRSTPAFVPVGTQAAMKAVLPEQMKELGAQCLLANAFHLFERPGEDVLDAAGGLARFMNWDGPTFTDSGGFQVMSLGVGFKKTLAMDVTGMKSDDIIAKGKERMAWVDEDGVTFKSP